MAGSTCAFCNTFVNANNPQHYHEVTSWVSGPKLDGPKLRSHTGRVAHKKCIENLLRGQAPDQPELDLGEDDEEAEVRALALDLQSHGPDEYPYGYYEALARERLERGAQSNG